MKSFVARLKLELIDRLRFSPLARRATARLFLAAGALGLGDDGTSLGWLCSAARAADDEPLLLEIERAMRRILERWQANLISSGMVPEKALLQLAEILGERGNRHIPKAAVLKPLLPGGERGVLFISFEYQWARLLNAANLAALAEEYTLVVSPTWNPPHCPVNLLFPAFYSEPLYCLISHQKDLSVFPRLGSGYRMVPLLASNWVNPALFNPRPRCERDIDIMVLSNFGTYKRHFALFKALRRLPASLRVVLVGTHHGKRTREVLLREAALYGVADRVEILQGVPDAVVTDHLQRAKISLILSKREGSCVAVVESLFADTPVGLLEGANIGSAQFINEATGRFLPEERLDEAISLFLKDAASMAPRESVLAQKIDCHGSTAVLNAQLEEAARKAGRPWTRSIATHHWRPDPQVLQKADREMEQMEVARIRDKYGIILGKL